MVLWYTIPKYAVWSSRSGTQTAIGPNAKPGYSENRDGAGVHLLSVSPSIRAMDFVGFDVFRSIRASSGSSLLFSMRTTRHTQRLHDWYTRGPPYIGVEPGDIMLHYPTIKPKYERHFRHFTPL